MNLNVLKWETVKENKGFELRVSNVEIADKKSLVEARKFLKERGFTEAKLLYRRGKYLMTIVSENVSNLDLAYMGYRKMPKNIKDDSKQ